MDYWTFWRKVKENLGEGVGFGEDDFLGEEESSSSGSDKSRPIQTLDNSREAVKEYRRVYRNLLRLKKPDHQTPDDLEITRKSVVSNCLYDAALNPQVRNRIVEHLLEASFAMILGHKVNVGYRPYLVGRE